MRTRVQRWGHSLGIRIPKVVADETGLGPDTLVDLKWDGRVITLSAVVNVPTLDELLAAVTPENLHGEFETGPIVGNEHW